MYYKHWKGRCAVGGMALLLGAGLARAQGNGPGTHGARAAALSNATAAVGGELWALGNNVAGLGELRATTAGAYAENRYFSPALNVAALAVALPLGRPGPTPGPAPQYGVVGLEVQRFGGSLYSETRLGAGYGYRLGLVAVGARVDLLQVSLQGLGSRYVVLASLGGQAEVLPRRLTFGAYLYNLSQAQLASYQDERVPTTLKAGLAYRPSSSVLLSAETEKDVERDANFKAGLEYRPAPSLALRLGLATLTAQTTAGVGLRFGHYELDYAAAWQSALGLSQHLSVSLQWKREEI